MRCYRRTPSPARRRPPRQPGSPRAADSGYRHQLVTNLIDNAVRHNIPGGDVQVATGIRDGHAVLSVANSGQVIPPAEVDRLFQPFQRLGPRPARHDGGHGLGLSIVRAIATAHGATIEARTLPEGGFTVYVTFFHPPGPRTPPGIQHRTRRNRNDRVPPSSPSPPRHQARAHR
jgi:signal transduction histidine kinase